MTDSRKPKVLVADDEYVITRCVAFMLRKEGFECRTVADGDAALAAVQDDPPDVLVLDLDMPRRDGFQVCRAIREDSRLSGVRVLVLTAQGQPLWSDWQSRIPADGFMLKPFDPRSLLDRVRALAQGAGESAAVGAVAVASATEREETPADLAGALRD